MIVPVFNSTAELVIPTGTQTDEARSEIKTQTLTAERKKRKC